MSPHPRLFALGLTAFALSFVFGAGVASAAGAPEVGGSPMYARSAGALLAGTVNPNGLATSYHFEYGDQGPCGANPCKSTPTQSAGSGEVALIPTEPISGLTANTTYHFRLVATNTADTTNGPDRSFTTNTGLPDNRGYEMISPPEKNGSDVDNNETVLASADGNAAIFASLGAFSESASAGILSYFRSQRTPNGWVTKGVSPPLPPLGSVNGVNVFMEDLNSNLTRYLMAGYPAPPTVPGTQSLAKDFLRRDINAGPFFENLTPLVPDPHAFQAGGGSAPFRAADDSLNRIAFNSDQQLTPDSPAGSNDKAYVWGNGEIHFAGIFPDNTIGPGTNIGEDGLSADGSKVIFEGKQPGDGGDVYLRRNPDQPQSALAHGASAGEGSLTAGSPIVSSITTTSGAFAVGQAIAGAGIPFGTTITALGAGTLTLSANAYETNVSDLSGTSSCTEPDKACTIEVSATRRTPYQAGHQNVGATFYDLSANGDKVVFFTGEGLLDSDTVGGLYQYQVSTDTLRKISIDSNPSDGNIAGVQNVIGASNDGSYIYFTATGRLVPGQPEIPGVNIYAWHDDGTASGSVAYVATLSATEELDNSTLSGPLQGELTEVSPSGRYFLFGAKTPFTSYDNLKPGGCGFKPGGGEIPDPNPRCLEIYRYDAQTGQLECVSCLPGSQATGDSAFRNLGNTQLIGIDPEGFHPNNMLDDGDVIFETEQAMTPADSNGQADVYEWHGGQVSLLSSGHSSDGSFFGASSPDGKNVFIRTRERLVGSDFDHNYDLYDARVGGGFPEPPPPPPCEGDSCQPPPVVPNDPTPASSGFSGAGNLAPRNAKARCPKGKRSVKARNGKGRCVAKKRTHKHNRANHNRRASR